MKTILYTVVFISLIILSCGKDSGGTDEPKPSQTLKEKISKTWVVQSVLENNATVYTKGNPSNIKPYYSLFKLTLQSNGNVVMNEVENTSITGSWSLNANDTRLVLNNLTPSPSESGGTLEFTINSADDKILNITASKVNHKTGGTTNRYNLEVEK